ncbi:hypothetical protein [Mycolicibacterium sp. XJ1819]
MSSATASSIGNAHPVPVFLNGDVVPEAGIQKRDSQIRCGPLSALPRDDKLFWLCLDVLQGQLSDGNQH